MRLIVLFIVFSNVKLTFAQNWSLSPFLGNAIMVSGTDKGLRLPNTLQTYDVNFSYPKLNYHLMSPLTFGLILNYKRNRITYSAGAIFGDQTWSNMQHYILRPNDNGLVYNSVISDGGGGGSGLYNIKIPLYFNYQLTKPLQRKNGVVVQFHTGINFSFYERWDESSFDADIMKKFNADGNDGWMILPFQYSTINTKGDQIDLVHWGANLNKGINLSFDLGLNLDWYLKSRNWVTTSLYYEQGLRNVSAVVYEIYVNGEYVDLDGAYSRGSAIHLKLLFPIALKKKKE